MTHANVFDELTHTSNERGYLFEIHGSNTIGAELAPSLIEGWLEDNSFSAIETMTTDTNEKEVSGISSTGETVKVFIAAHGSGTGFKKALANQADIAAASRPVKQSENDLFPKINLPDFETEVVLAIDGLAVIINPGIKIDELSINQVGRLFSGQITNWRELGGPNIAVSVHARDNNSGTYDTFKTLVLTRGFKLANTTVRYESNDVLSTMVTNTVGAIGFTSLASIGQSKAVKIMDGEASPIAPSYSAIATEDYPLARRLYLYQMNNKNRYALDFLSYVKTNKGQQIVGAVGFVSQNLQELTMKITGQLPAGYTFVTEKSKRITTNFRFNPNTKTLDNKAIDDLHRLAAYMNHPENITRRLILIGFSNQQKDEFKARLLSESRVIFVKRELGNLGVTASALTGYGQINPVASNDDLRYSLRNQRVEVWIR